jgi:hypothetical protein
MLGEKGDYSILLYAGLIIVFILLAIIGSYAIVAMTGNHASGNVSPGPESTTGIGYDLIYLNDSLQWIRSSSLQHTNNGNFSGIANIDPSGSNTDSYKWLIMAFVDYNLTPIYYNGNLEKSHMIALQSPGQHIVSFQLTGLQNGTHDIVFLSVIEPRCNHTDEVAIRRGETSISGIRFTLVVGNASASTIQYNAGPLEEFVTFKNNSKINIMSSGPWLTAKPFFVDEANPFADAISSINAKPGEVIEYYIDVRNGEGPTNEANSRFAIMQLLDYEQRPLRHDMLENVYFGALNPGQTLALHADIIAPLTSGKHILSPIFFCMNPDGEFDFYPTQQIIVNVVP